MDSQYQNNKSLCLDRNKNLLNEIINIEKFKKLDDKYMVTDICRNINLKYEFNENQCSIYYKSFSCSISFDKNNFKSLVCFIDSKLFNSVDKDKFILFLKNIVENKQLDISVKYLRNILNKVLDGAVKEVKEIKDNVNLYIEKIVNDNREIIFMMVNLNA